MEKNETDCLHKGDVRSFPPSLTGKLAEAARWYTGRAELERQIAFSAGSVNGSAQRNQDDRDESDREGASLLLEIVEEMEDAWGFGRDI